MTLEEIKAEIEAYGMTAKGTCLSNHKDFAYGLASGLSFALEALENLEPTWHEYPKEKPKKSGLYLTCWNGGFLIQRWLTSDGFEFKIDSWMELPKPYKKEAET